MVSIILWVQHDGQDHNADDHEESDDNDIQTNHDHNYADTFYPGLGGWHSCFLASAFWPQGWEKMNPVFDFLKSGTETVCKAEGW